MDDSETINGVLPDNVRQLISRKVRLRRRVQKQEYADNVRLVHSKLKAEIEAVICTSKISRALTSLPLAAFEEIVAEATSVTKSWPGVVWSIITSIVDQVPLGSHESHELHALMDELAWGENQTPFTYAYVAADPFQERFYRLIGSYGVQRNDLRKGFERMLNLKAAAAGCGVLNQARWAREEVGVAIDEYVYMKSRSTNEISLEVSLPSVHAQIAKHPSECQPTPSDSLQVFRGMESLSFNEISVVFVGDQSEYGLGSNNLIEISARNEVRRVALSELNLVDRRTGALNTQAAILVGMAHKQNPSSGSTNSQKISRLRKKLRTPLGIEGDPFHPVGKNGTGKRTWIPRFSIADKRGAADRRARDEALRRTISSEDIQVLRDTPLGISPEPFSEGTEPGEEWLKKNDPDYPHE